MKIKTSDFNLQATLESGQVFGFTRLKPGIYEGVISGASLKIRDSGNSLFINLSKKNLSPRSIIDYFDLDRDLSAIYAVLMEDPKLKALMKLKGLRIIRQDPWEAIACFIISSNNNIKRIKLIRKNIVENLGEAGLEFPPAIKIAEAGETFLRRMGLGFRADYLRKSAARVADNPSLISEIRDADYARAREILMDFPGIGGKIADCVLLFAFQRYESFPVDVWIQRIISKLYFSQKETAPGEVLDFSRKRWGNIAGYVQQYLYHGARTGII